LRARAQRLFDPNCSYVAPFFIETVNARGEPLGDPERRMMIAAA
jgi:hypothetical protein